MKNLLKTFNVFQELKFLQFSKFKFSSNIENKKFINLPEPTFITNKINNESLLNRSIHPKIIVKPNKTVQEFKDEANSGIFITMTSEEKFNYSCYKLNKCLQKIRNKYLEDAEKILENDHSKGGKLLKKKLTEFKENNPELFPHLNFKSKSKFDSKEEEIIERIKNRKNDNNHNQKIEKDKDEHFYLKIKSATVGKLVGHSKVMFRAKGRADMLVHPHSTLRIQFEKVSKEKICEEMVKGKTPLFLRKMIREKLYKNKSSLKEVEALSFLSSSRGCLDRQRLIRGIVRQIKMKYYEQNNSLINFRLIRAQLLKEMTYKMIPIYNKYFEKKKKRDDSKYSSFLSLKTKENRSYLMKNRKYKPTEYRYDDNQVIDKKNTWEIKKRNSLYTENYRE